MLLLEYLQILEKPDQYVNVDEHVLVLEYGTVSPTYYVQVLAVKCRNYCTCLKLEGESFNINIFEILESRSS